MNEVEFVIKTPEIIGLFQTVLVPVLMISGVGLFILIIQTRYGRVVDRIRTINNERLVIIKRDIVDKVSKIERRWNEYRLQDLQKQVSILLKRGQLLKSALQYMFISIFTSILSSTILFIEQIIEISFSMIVILLFAISMIMIFVACLNVIREVTTSYNAVMFDIDTHVPKEYRLKTEFGVLGDLEKEKDNRKIEL